MRTTAASYLYVALVAGLITSPLYGQAAATGTIAGTVQDGSGAVLPGATVELSGERVMGVRTAVTGETGEYRFRSLPPGNYELSVTLSGFAPARRTDVRVLVGATVEENVALNLEGVTEAVTVI
ncbi:MAG: carboxypeptidase-like regulatory domain-containing protein, partial [Vicinamibacteria bacterium]